MRTSSCWAGVALCLLGLGCATRSDLTAVSSKNVNVSRLRLDPERSKGRAYGEDCTHIIIVVPTGGDPTIDEAIDRALESKGANLLTDAVIRQEYFYIPYLYGRTCWKAEGDAYDTFE
jgi:hypothetical protein